MRVIMKQIYRLSKTLFVLLALTGNVFATTITVGTGTTTNTPQTYPAPYGNWYWGAKHQFLITATELTTAGMSAGDINSLAFDVAQVNGVALQDFTISLKNTASASLSTFETGLTTVYGPQNYTETNGLNTHIFIAPFYWDGISNLLIETCFNNNNFTQNARTFYSNTGFNSCVYYRQDQSGVCSSATPTQTTMFRPNMIFDWAPSTIPPVANFTANTTYTCSGLIDFTDLSTNFPTSWNWDFGDGGSDTTQNPSYTYASNGTYDVTLIACNAFGCDTITFTNYITVNTSSPTPVAASCTPSTLTYCCGFGIDNVSFNTLNNSSNDGVDGYSDFTCSQTTVFEGQTYTLSIQTSASSTQNYAAWIDFNNDGIFNNVSERVFTASSQLNTSGSVSIPVGAVLNTPLRLRVAADYDFSAPPMPCTNVDYGQVEDYTIIITPNPNPPTAAFSATPTYTSSGTICFTDLSQNVPTGWLWDFGDGSTSFQQSPCHTYTVDGTYTIILTVTNANGSDADTIVNYVTINTAGQLLAATCSPATTAYCCAYGIYQVDFNTISNATNDGIDGYKNYSCQHSTSVMEGTSQTITVRTGVNNPQDTRVWIDFNNDGSFNNTNELIMDAPNDYDPSITFNIPGGAVLNTPLRMRISSDVVGTAQSACDANDFGQTEDYGVTILPNTSPPNSSFSANITATCSDTICFTDLSSGLPTSWLWNFGDGNTSTDQNPCHYYASPGNYTVTLTATNSFGSDFTSINNYISVNCSNLTMPTSGTDTHFSCSGTLYDDGGQFANYSDNTDGLVVIQPTGASTVTLNFTFFDFRTNPPGDTLFLYDGASSASPLIGKYTGNFGPTGLVTSSAGVISIRQKSDGFSNDPGFAVNWSCSLVGVDEVNDLANQILVYPNPAQNVINIQNNAAEQINEVIMFNTIGEMVLSQYVYETKFSIGVNDLPRGIYFLNIKTENQVITKKVIIQ